MQIFLKKTRKKKRGKPKQSEEEHLENTPFFSCGGERKRLAESEKRENEKGKENKAE